MFGWFRKKVDSTLVMYRQMDKLSVLIAQLEAKARRLKGTQEALYWEDQWNEAMHLYMEFEWYFHPRREEYECVK